MSSSLFCRLASRTRNSVPFKNTTRFSSTTSGTGLRPRTLRPLATLSAAAALSIGAYTLGAIYPPATISILFPQPAPGPPDPSSAESIAYSEALEAKLQNLPEVQRLREAPDAADWYEARPYQNFPEERRVNNLTAGALRGPGKLACIPLIRAKKDETESIVFIHVGRGLCGHDGIVHGGLLATLLDETLARTAIINLPDKVGVTAKLSLNYRAPTRADQFIVIRTSLAEAKGRKAVVKGRVEDLEGVLLVEAEATFVQPRYAKLLNSKALRDAMGEAPKDEPILLADGQQIKPKHS
ncbi:Thioesterase/thiol ester dehydrase-isomerase [Macrolepiota fuliginosa MF-IS2]|uniref:Thioesterase/thiol ester dehydrase-isomerase n=1 Tax=Macrolepiota fuliginosa MF-IS2 TaxID=1400762 RepID=A0A9P5X9J2_9AGAR|nr:Thioesterase/thiol ester dehydrase-isomerase [Macrolepiota fuliginosa MF-IS2]